MSNYSGLLEAEAILARLRSLAGGRIYDGGAPDEEAIERDSNGTVRPYGVVMFGEAIPDKSEPTLAGRKSNPFLLPVTIQWVAGRASDMRALAAAGMELLLEWAPTPTSEPMEPQNGGEFITRDAQDRPSRFNRLAHYPLRINL